MRDVWCLADDLSIVCRRQNLRPPLRRDLPQRLALQVLFKIVAHLISSYNGRSRARNLSIA